MATKLKSYKFKRAFALIIATVMIFTSGIFTCFLVKGVFYYNSYKTNAGYTDTSVFRSNLTEFERTVLLYGETCTCSTMEEYLKTEDGKVQQKRVDDIKKTVENSCNYLDSQGVKIIEEYDELTYILSLDYSSYEITYEGETIYTHSTFDDSEIEDGDEIYTTFNDVSAKENEIYAKTRDAISNIYEYCGEGRYGIQSNEELVKLAADSTSNLVDTHNRIVIDNLNNVTSSIKYAVFYPSTGKVLTNCGVKYTDDTEAVLKKLGGEYTEYIENGKVNTIGGSKTGIRSEVYNDIKNAVFEDTGINTIEKDNYERAYFSFAPAKDYFGASQSAYNSFLSQSGAEKRSLNTFLAIAIITLLIGMASCIYYIAIAGKCDDGTVKTIATDKVPFIINAGFSFGAIILLGMGIIGLAVCEYMPIQLFIEHLIPYSVVSALASKTNLLTAIFYSLIFVILTLQIASIIRNIKNKTFFKHTLCHYLLIPVRFILRKIRSLLHRITEKAKVVYANDYAYGNGKKILIIGTVIICAVMALNFFVLVLSGVDRTMIGCIIGLAIDLAIITYLVLCLVSFDRIASGVSEIKMGSLTCTINTRLMPGFLKSLAEDIATIRSGLSNAVQQAVKEQATKTELLTNVTHDLKTPLTSIINYVDLLKNTDDPETQKEYIKVLDEKSQRLKKLIDDLVQASKAASGNVDVNAIKLNLCEFATQIIGEYEDELKNNEIELVLKVPDEAVEVIADGNITVRIFKNLLINIKKYTLKGTRVYIDVASDESCGIITFKNISSAPLEADAEKFTERFYRGDTARSGEGNGLGLAIASDLAKAQGGTLSIETDGDLFKVMVTMPRA